MKINFCKFWILLLTYLILTAIGYKQEFIQYIYNTGGPVTIIIFIIFWIGIIASGWKSFIGNSDTRTMDLCISFTTKLGLLGTFIGFMSSFSSFANIDFTDPGSVQIASKGLMEGLHVAFMTTIVGMVANITLLFHKYFVGRDR